MKHRRKPGSFSFRAVWGTPAFLFLTAVFLCGAAAGSLTGLRSAAIEGKLVTELADSVLAIVDEKSLDRLLLSSFLPALGWPMAALLCGALRPHSLFLSALTAARGFLFAFAIGAMLGAWSTAGIARSALSCAVSGVCAIPALLAAATAAFQAASEQPARRAGYLYALGRYRGALAAAFTLSMLGGALRVIAILTAHRLWPGV